MYFLKTITTLTIIISSTICIAQNKTLSINEFLASNSKGIMDGFGENDDWIELYNHTDSTIQLAGMFFTDDPSNPTKHVLGNSGSWTSISGKGFFLIWADNDPEQGKRHLSFELNKEGGYIGLFDQDTTLLDELYYEGQKKNQSQGRSKVDNDIWAIFKNPTPKFHNKDGLKLNPKKVFVESSIHSGFYNEPQIVKLTTEADGKIFYSMDGSRPGINSTEYSGPIHIDSTTVLRARIIKEGYLPNVITSNTYFIKESSTLSVLSLIVDPKDLWRKKKGIYSNFEKRGLEVPAHIEYYDTITTGDLKLAIAKSVKTRIAGKTSRRQPKKSFALFPTEMDEKGDRFEYAFFNDKDIQSFGGLMIRADATSGRNVPELWVGERFKNELLYEVNKQMNGNIDMQAYQPVSVFLNGKYWGLYNLMERKGKDFISNNHGEKEVDILTAEDAKIVTGNINEYDQLMFYIAQNDITTDSVYQKVCEQIQIESYIDYWVNETYCGARDINVNIRFWKSKNPGSKWRWISYDQDSWYTYKEESLKYYLDNGKVFFLGRLMKNWEFKKQWINRMCDYLNTGFKGDNVTALVDQITNRIDKEVLRDRNRWSDSMLYIPRGQRVRWIKDYAYKRPDFLRQNMIDYFKLPGKINEITVKQPNQHEGYVKINTIYPTGKIWKGHYLSHIPIKIEAIPNEGYQFVRWKKGNLPKNAELEIDTRKNKKFEPVFERISLDP